MNPAELLVGTSPAPWAVEGFLVMDAYRSSTIVMVGETDGDPRAEADVRLVVAAPELARRLARAEDTLREIAREDYRGPEPEARRLARNYFEVWT